MRARRTRTDDEIVRDGESVVLVGHTVVRLSALATTILHEITDSGWRDSVDLSQTLELKHGPAPEGTDPVAMTETALTDMQEQGLVECLSP